MSTTAMVGNIQWTTSKTDWNPGTHFQKSKKSPTVVIQHMCSEVLCTQSVWMMHVFDLHMQ